MFEMFKNSVVLFFRGKLFQDLHKVILKIIIGSAIAVALLVITVKLGLHLSIAVIITSIVAGAIQPWLFKDLKYC